MRNTAEVRRFWLTVRETLLDAPLMAKVRLRMQHVDLITSITTAYYDHVLGHGLSPEQTLTSGTVRRASVA